ncbi:MAG TPA: hypothetical protein VHB21_16665 [Minicystis sp.]|nr:hypothetical protein [Minicystis sp.]
MPRPSPTPLPAAVLACALAATGCGDLGGGPVTSLFVVPKDLAELREASFFDQPWPSDLRLEHGAPRLEGYYNPRNLPLLAEYIDAMKGKLDGFSPAAAGFVRFDGPLDTSTLPADPAAALDPSASVQLIDVDPRSPEHGARKLVSLEFREAAGIYWRPNTLAFMPTFGFPLRPHTHYAFVVTSRVKAKDGGEIGRPADLDAVLGLASASRRLAVARDALAPAVAEIEAAGIDKRSIVTLAAFTTADPTAEMFAIRDAMRDVVPAPVADPSAWAFDLTDPAFDEYVGSYGPSPNFQHGRIPFAEYGDGGGLRFKAGVPVVANTFDLRFSLSVPKASACPMPQAGYPIVLYAHGTGGDYRSYVFDGTARALALQCVATMGIDQIFHGARPGAPPDGSESEEELLFFNFQNIDAARTNTRQAAADEIQRARLFTESHLAVPASVSTSHQEIRFDASKLMFFGHSQGGLNGPLYLAADASARGGVLSGSSADISITLLEKTSPPPSVAGLVTTVFLGLRESEVSEVDPFHPAISLAQSIVDVVDPIHYARYTIREPRPGFHAKSVYMTEGINPDGTGDTYAPPHGIEAHSIAMGLPLQLPGEHPILEEQWGGPRPVAVPATGLSGNLGRGEASGVLAQWAVPPGDDGHFVVFDVPEAQSQAARFVKDLGDDPKGDVPPP